MRLFAIALSLSVSVCAFADDKAGVVAIDEFLKAAEKGTDPAEDPTCDGACTGSDRDYWYYNEEFRTMNAVVCQKKPLDVAEVCEDVGKWCASRGTSKSCRTYSVSIVKKRLADDARARALRLRMYKDAQSIFEKYRSNPDIHKTCCGKDESCIARFKDVKMVVLTGLGEKDLTGQYSPRDHRLEFSEGQLVDHHMPQGLERLFNHEFGHVCQYSRHHDNEAALDMISSGVQYCRDGHLLGHVDLNATVGESTRKCIFKAIDDFIQVFSAESETCKGSYITEAFANTIFAEHLTAFSSYGMNCSGVGDKVHAEVRSYQHCIFERAEVRKALCGKYDSK